MRKKQFFFTFLFRIFSDFERNFFRLLAKKLQDVFKTTFYVSRGTVCGFFFKKFWTVLDFLSKPLWWFSKFYLRVQSKNCGRNSFFLFSFQNFFSNFDRKFFRLLAKKLQEVVKSTFCVLRVQRNSLWLEFFFLKFWIVLYFLKKPSAWFPKLYLRVQSKNCGRNSFLIFLFRIFSDSERNSSDFRPKNVKNLSKLPYACPEEQFVAWNFFLKVLNRFGFSAETFGMVLKSLSTCPE